MLRCLHHRLAGLVLTLLIGLGALAGAFGQRMPSPGDLAFAAYVAAGGNPADLCGAPNDPAHPHQDCPVCHAIGSAVDLSSAPAIGPADLVMARLAAPAAAPRIGPARLWRSVGSRGPPASLA